mgnify:CR=1 FL=1
MKKQLQNYKVFLGLGFVFFIISFFIAGAHLSKQSGIISPNVNPWAFRSIDTMKYSRDLAREKLGDTTFDQDIRKQIEEISSTGATHVAIATPYDEEFYPILKRWVDIAREYQLNVWFRGNFSGWEGWFEYKKLTRDEHIAKTESFITNHKELFIDGDVFTACPECENGGPGDPRATGDTKGHRKFLIDEYSVTKKAFSKLRLSVPSNFVSMNFDVAKLIMDKSTTSSLDGIVTIDHYVKSPKVMKSDIDYIAQKSRGKIVIGEFGAPIPDINGEMDEKEQNLWLDEVLGLLYSDPNVIGINYWVSRGGSTQLWDESGKERQAVKTLRSYLTRP